MGKGLSHKNKKRTNGWKNNPRSNNKKKKVKKNVDRSTKKANVYVPSFVSDPQEMVLVLGDGDFSFGTALVKRRGTAGRTVNTLCTSYDSRKEVLEKYGDHAKRSLEALKKYQNCEVLHGVDATKLQGKLSKRTFDTIMFNFPHTGSQRVHENRALLHDFFANVRPFLNIGGKVDVTMNCGPPYNSWDIEKQAKASNFVLVKVQPFLFSEFPGYTHQTTVSNPTSTPEPMGQSKTFSFMPI